MPNRTLEVWFDFASTYSYIAIDRLIRGSAVPAAALLWRPFLLGPVFRELGWSDSPFNLQKAKGAYMWRDLERECARLGIPFRRPSMFPRNGLLAARCALAGEGTPWMGAFIGNVFRANFSDDKDIADAVVIAALLADSGCPEPAAAIAAAGSPAIKTRLREQTSEAMARGIFGAPSLIVGAELFWGSDRLDQALGWAERPG